MALFSTYYDTHTPGQTVYGDTSAGSAISYFNSVIYDPTGAQVTWGPTSTPDSAGGSYPGPGTPANWRADSFSSTAKIVS